MEHWRGIGTPLLKHGCVYLTSCDGVYSNENFTAEMEEMCKHSAPDNVKLCERKIGETDYFYRRFVNGSLGMVNGLVMAKNARLLDDEVLSTFPGWTDAHTEALIDVCRSNEKKFG